MTAQWSDQDFVCQPLPGAIVLARLQARRKMKMLGIWNHVRQRRVLRSIKIPCLFRVVPVWNPRRALIDDGASKGE